MKYITVDAAYGVKLNTKAEVKAHFDANKDFRILSLEDSGRYINKADVLREGNIKLEVRYGKRNEKVCVL